MVKHSTDSLKRVLCHGVSGLTLLLVCLAADAGQAQSRFTYSTDGAQVTDAMTGLVWRRCSLGQAWDEGICKGDANTFTHKDIGVIVKTLYEGWRVPTKKELSSLVDETETWSKINKAAFPATPRGGFLTWTPPVGDSDSCPSYDARRSDDPESCAYFVNFEAGLGDYILINANFPGYVRLVRK